MMLHETRQESLKVWHDHYTERINVSWIVWMTVAHLLFPGAPCADSGWTSGKQMLPGSSEFITLMAGGKKPEGFTYGMGVFSQGRFEPGRSCARLFIQSCAAFRERRPLRTASPLISPKLRAQPPHTRSFPLECRAECGRQQTERENHTRHKSHV